MARHVSSIYSMMDDLVSSHSVYLFEPLDDEDPFEPFEGIPIKVQSEMAVRVTKTNSEIEKGTVIWIDVDEFCFMKITKLDKQEDTLP